MARNKNRRRGGKVLGLALLAVAIVFGLLATGLLPWGSTEFRLRPNAKIQTDADYGLNVWLERPVLSDLRPWQQGIDQAITEFREVYPNVTVTLSLLAPDEAAGRLNQAISQGNPPDVFFGSNSSQCYFGELQLPLGRFIDKQERSAWPDSLWQQAEVDGAVLSLPVAAYPQVFMVNTSLFTQTSLAAIQQPPETWSQLLAGAERATSGNVYGFVPTSTGAALLRCLAASIGKPAPCTSTGEPLWTKEDLLMFAQVWQEISQSPASPNSGANMDSNCLDLFLGKKAAVIGPVNHSLASWLWGAAADREIAPKLLPVPYLTETGYADVRTLYINLFRQEPYQGHDHTRAAAELAQFLAPRLGRLLSSLTGALPATAVNEAAGFLPYDQDSFLVYSDVSHAPGLPYAYGPEAGVTETHWNLAITPAWDRLIRGEYTAEQFADAVLTELAMATITGP
jgi:multiple sugar transport system substrate-binding protein